MPYIREERRTSAMFAPANAGELNYALTKLMILYWNTQPQRYQALNDISGAATEALAEFRRRVLVPYEKTKIAENGDVYG